MSKFQSEDDIVYCNCEIYQYGIDEKEWLAPYDTRRNGDIVGFGNGSVHCPKCGEKFKRRKRKVKGIVIKFEGNEFALVPLKDVLNLIEGKDFEYELFAL